MKTAWGDQKYEYNCNVLRSQKQSCGRPVQQATIQQESVRVDRDNTARVSAPGSKTRQLCDDTPGDVNDCKINSQHLKVTVYDIINTMMQSQPLRKVILLSLLFAALSAQRLTVDIYTESLCPDCITFIKHSLTEALNTDQIDQMVHIRVVPYGNVVRKLDPSGVWIFDCQHGTVECYGNMIQLCGQQRMISQYGAEDELKQVEWVACIDRRIFKPYKSAVFNQAATLCARDYGLDSQSIIDCANGEEGYRLHLAAAEETDRLSPAHQYVPWIVANRRHDVTAENQILDNLVQWACNNYSGQKIPACVNYQTS